MSSYPLSPLQLFLFVLTSSWLLSPVVARFWSFPKASPGLSWLNACIPVPPYTRSPTPLWSVLGDDVPIWSSRTTSSSGWWVVYKSVQIIRVQIVGILGNERLTAMPMRDILSYRRSWGPGIRVYLRELRGLSVVAQIVLHLEAKPTERRSRLLQEHIGIYCSELRIARTASCSNTDYSAAQTCPLGRRTIRGDVTSHGFDGHGECEPVHQDRRVCTRAVSGCCSKVWYPGFQLINERCHLAAPIRSPGLTGYRSSS